MILVANLETLLKHWVFTLIFIIVLTITGIFAYRIAVKSRKYYKCPQCGESFCSEHMDSQFCKVCGAKLEQTYDTNVNDKVV